MTRTPSSMPPASRPSSSSRKSPSSLSTNLPALSLLLLVLLSLLQSCSAQQYHFSNGWYPGKKRSSPSSTASLGSAEGLPSAGSSASSSSSSSNLFRLPSQLLDTPCSIRLETMRVINKLLMEEAARIQRSCTVEASFGLRDLLEGTNKMSENKDW